MVSRLVHSFLGSLAVLAAACTPSASPSARPFEASVGPTEARFTFPVPDRATWEWCSPATPDNQEEYAWGVAVISKGGDYSIGFSLFKHSGAAPSKGDLAALVRGGQSTVWKLGKEGAAAVPGTEVIVEPHGDSLRFLVRDRKTLDLLFSDRPASATFTSEIPGEPRTTRRVEIAYSRS